MKTTTFLQLPKFTAFGGALFKNNKYVLSILWLIIVTLWNTHSVTAAPAKLDSLDSTFPLDFQPPVFEATKSASPTPTHRNGRSSYGTTTIDSYGNAIVSLQPIQTPDGRKVVSAEGLQFEIPNYASGITELKKPDDDLLPPFVGEFSNNFDKRTSSITDSVDGLKNDDLPGFYNINKDHAQAQTNLDNDDYEGELQLQDIRRVKRQPHHTTDTNITNSNDNDDNAREKVLKTQNTNNITNDSNKANTNTLNNKRPDPKQFSTNPIPSSNLENNLNIFENNIKNNLYTFNNSNSNKIISRHSSSFSHSHSPHQRNIISHLPSSKTKLSAHFIPLSNGNFNYPNLPTDESIIERLVSKYKNPLPTLDPIVVALPHDSKESMTTTPSVSASAEQTTSIDVESVPLVELNEKQPAIGSHGALTALSKQLPDYILELNDPDIGGPVDYNPDEDKHGLNVIAWDLLPPREAEIVNEKSLSHKSITTGHNLLAEASQDSSQSTEMPQLGLRNSLETINLSNHQNKLEKAYTSTTTTTTPRTTTTTTAKTTITTRTTTPRTTRRTTTPRTTTTTSTTPEPDSSEFFKLEAGDSYTLPPWLQDIDDPDLDVAVTFEIPEDINEYNHTVERDLLAPLAPFTDLHNIHLTPPTNRQDSSTTPRTTSTTTTTTRSPIPLSTNQPHWVRVKPTAPKPTKSTFNKQITSLNPSITSSTNYAQRTTSKTTGTTTVKPKSSISYYNQQFSSNTAQTDKIGSTSSSSEEDNSRSNNAFLGRFDDGKYKPQQTNRRATISSSTTTSTTSTTTTTTPAPIIYEKNPFEPTIPPWLKDFDYPGLGPAVPFIYNPNEDENPVDKNILPPSKSEEDPNQTNQNSNSPFLNAQKPEIFKNQFSTSALSLTSSSSIPSITTIPFPSAQQTNQDDDDDNSFARPPHIFVPPTSNMAAEGNNDISKKTSTTFNKNFPAPFDSTSSGTSNSDQKKVPLSADRESFPPFNNIITSPSTVSSKSTFSKSEDGKVITNNNIFLNGDIGSKSLKPVGSAQIASNLDKNSLSTQTSTGSSLTTSAAASAFVLSKGSSANSEDSKYTGRFGGPPGVLAPQVNAFTSSSSDVTKSVNKPAVPAVGVNPIPTAATNNKDKFTGSFGGPPGILKPYDNIKNR